ncbi:MAG: hypothetical protein MZV64_29690 [Ignavibacteriales bacterium]|nr:hypothetical protein [Ignavibacteriales bacterium]
MQGRISRTRRTFSSTMSLAGEFDRSDDAVGYNTGFAAIALASPEAVSRRHGRLLVPVPPAR